MQELTQQELKKVLNYSPNSGEFHWKISSGSVAKGKIAGRTTSNSRYNQISIYGTSYLAHRLAYLYMVGYFPIEIDHKDTNGLNNCWTNLRHATPTINKRNRHMPKNNTSGVTGVTWDKSRNKWKAFISFTSGKSTNLGRFTRKEDAVAARISAIEIAKHYTSLHGSTKVEV